MDPTQPKRAVIYARVSTEKQRERHTIASQLSVMPEIVRQHGYVLVDEPYVDDGVSGETINERPGMMRLLEDGERNLFDAIFVIDLDRLTRARKSLDWEIIKDVCRRNHIYVITPSQTYDFANEDHEFISDIFSRISAFEKKKILRRSIRGKFQKVKQGRFIGGRRPYGYRIVERQFEIHEEEAAVVREIFQRCLDGQSCESIQRALTDAGYPTPLGHRTPWAKSSVVRILHDSKYAGEFVRWKWKREDPGIGKRGSIGTLVLRKSSEWVTVHIPAIITRETFETAHRLLSSRKSFSKRNSKREYLLSGLLWCASCGCRMTGECYSHEQRYYVCWNRRRKRLGVAPCPNPACPADPIEASVWDAVVSLLSQPGLIEKAIHLAKSGAEHTQGEAVMDHRRLERLIQARVKERERLIHLYMIEAIDTDTVKPQLLKIKDEIASLEAQLSAALAIQRQVNRVSSISKVWKASRVHSVAGLLTDGLPLLTTRPFRSPHHSISDAGLIGGGVVPRPGEVSLAHNGVLFLDEILEFKRHVLDGLRQPLEDETVTLTRASGSLRYPARIMLVAAMNPCPCGYYGDRTRDCLCTPHQIRRYRARLSGPLQDRLDIHIEVPPVRIRELGDDTRPHDTSATIRARVTAARARQADRYEHDGIFTNAQLRPRQLKKYCRIDAAGRNVLEQAMTRLGLSARAYGRILRVARTIADLAGSEHIAEIHLAEAIQYRSLDRRGEF